MGGANESVSRVIREQRVVGVASQRTKANFETKEQRKVSQRKLRDKGTKEGLTEQSKRLNSGTKGTKRRSFRQIEEVSNKEYLAY